MHRAVGSLLTTDTGIAVIESFVQRCSLQDFFEKIMSNCRNVSSYWGKVNYFKKNKKNKMEDFVFLFRQPVGGDNQVSPTEIQAIFKKWDDWFGGIADQGRLNNTGIRLADPGKVLKKGGIVTDGPFVEIRERLNGFIVVKAENIDDAITLAHGCPILEINGTVEIRPFLMSEQRQYHLLSGKSALKS